MDYKQSEVSGSSWVRCNQIVVVNPADNTPKFIQFREEQIINVGEEHIARELGVLMEYFNEVTTGEEIQILNPVTGEATGAVLTYADVYAILYSSYMHAARKRDDVEQA